MNIMDYVNGYASSSSSVMILTTLLIVLAVVIVVMVISIIKEKNKNVEDAKFDINETKEALECKMEDNNDKYIRITEYENDQEKKAIISYDELLKNASSLTISYEDETNTDGIKVRKVELDKEKPNMESFVTEEIKVKSFYSFEREEEFLKTLKQFRANL